MDTAAVLSTASSVTSIIVAVTVLITFKRNSAKRVEDTVRKEMCTDNAIAEVAKNLKEYEDKAVARFDAIQYSIDDLNGNMREQGRKLDQLVWEHIHNHPASKIS
jgi:hypothetical protein